MLVGQGKPVTNAVRVIGVTEATCYRWHSKFGGLKLEGDRVRRVVADLTLEKLVLKKAASGNW